MKRYVSMISLIFMMCGCPLPWHPDTPIDSFKKVEPTMNRPYWMYVPSNYHKGRKWPLVVTLHGTFGYDWAHRQADEWKYLAETHGFLVAAPAMKSVQGILPVVPALWYKDLEADDRMILAVIDKVCRDYNVDEKAILLTGFSAGGYPLWNTGLRHPERFNMLIARFCNSDTDLFRRIRFTEAARNLPVMIFWGKDDVLPIKGQGWQALRFLRLERRCFKVEYRKISGGHFRKPEVAYKFWLKYLPKQYHPEPGAKIMP